MAEPEANKRLQPKMTRGAFRFQFVLWSIWTVLQLVLVVANLAVWDLGDYLALAGVALGMIYLGYLSYLRHRDGHVWQEEEAKRANWDRRGRAL